MTLGAGTRIGAHVVISSFTTMGTENVVHPFAAIGGDPQVHKRGAASRGTRKLVIGDRNVIREHVTIHRGSLETPTRIGSNNLLMVGCHIAHDVQVGSSVTVANQVQLAGHTIVEDHATFGGLAGLAQFVRVGQSAFVAAGAMCEADVPPFVIVQGDRARVRGLNRVGLQRRGVPETSVAVLERAFRAIFQGDKPRSVALGDLGVDDLSDPYVAALVAFLRARSLAS